MDPVTSAIYWIEGRPAEGGRDVIVEASKGQDVFGKEWNARTGVQEVRDKSLPFSPGTERYAIVIVWWRPCDSIQRCRLLLQLRGQ